MPSPDDRTITADFGDQFEIDQLCNDFEELWKRGEAPDISSFLDRTNSNLWPTLFVELVQIDMEYRSHKGEAPTVDEYASRFPQFAGQLASLGSSITESKIKRLSEIREIGGFKLLQRIGSGTFGVVWKAWDPDLEREVAVKLPTERSLSREYANDFRREAKAAAKLSHPGIVRVIDYGVQDGFSYIVYDLIDGINLKQWARRNPITPKEAGAMCAKIADAVSHAHANGVVHRDLKPSNVLIDREGKPIITDFGLAKRDDSASTVGGSGAIVGTFAYMSPEQAEGKSRNIDARSDIYSLGALLYELLSGRQLVQGDPREALHKILNVAPDRLSTIAKGVHPDIETVCHKCLEKRPDDRYRTAADLAADLNRFVAGDPVQARPVPRRVRAWRWVRKHRWTVALLLLATLPLAAAMVAQAMKPERILAAAVEPRTVHFSTEPPGAMVLVRPCNPKTGEPELSTPRMPEWAPATLELLPGPYLVHVTLPEADGTNRFHIVHRTVSGRNGEWPSLGAYWQSSPSNADGEIEWRRILVPPKVPLFEMAYVPGTEQFTVDGPEGQKSVRVAPFFVAVQEYTYADLFTIRPELVDWDRPEYQRPAGHAMACRYDMAEHWAEESGCRLLTDLEYAYLAHLAAEAQAGREVPGDVAVLFDLAGGTMYDAIELPGQPPIRGILTGYAEWTSTWPHSPLATIDFSRKVEHPDRPESYRIIRGGTISCGPEDYPRDPGLGDVATISVDLAHVGFRLARSVPLTE